MQTKTRPVQLKAGEDDGLGDGQFEALVSVFGNVDSMGDRVVKGAFANTLAEWKDSGDPIPVLWSHRLEDPDYHIGVVLEAEERDTGLWVKGQLDLDAPKAKQVFRLLKGRRVKEFSFAYDVKDEGPAESDKDVNELREVKLWEVGPTLIGANPDTQLLGTKRALAKAGRVLSAKNEADLRSAAELISNVLAQLDRSSDDGKAKTSQPAADEDRDTGKSEEPARCSPARARLLADLEAFDVG